MQDLGWKIEDFIDHIENLGKSIRNENDDDERVKRSLITPYIMWIIIKFANGLIQTTTDIYNTVYYILVFDHYKRKGKIAGSERDITKKTPDDIIDIVDTIEKEERESKVNVIESALRSKDTKILYESSKHVVAVPLTYETSCALGAKKWCTVYREESYKEYKDQGDLNIILLKDGNGYSDEKYQIHFHTGQVMDKRNEYITIEYLVRKFPFLTKVFSTNPIINSDMTWGEQRNYMDDGGDLEGLRYQNNLSYEILLDTIPYVKLHKYKFPVSSDLAEPKYDQPTVLHVERKKMVKHLLSWGVNPALLVLDGIVENRFSFSSDIDQYMTDIVKHLPPFEYEIPRKRFLPVLSIRDQLKKSNGNVSDKRIDRSIDYNMLEYSYRHFRISTKKFVEFWKYTKDVVGRRWPKGYNYYATPKYFWDTVTRFNPYYSYIMHRLNIVWFDDQLKKKLDKNIRDYYTLIFAYNAHPEWFVQPSQQFNIINYLEDPMDVID